LTAAAPRAVVFANHNVGVRCLAVLVAAGVDVALVVTHREDPGENNWFGSVAESAKSRGLPVAMPESPDEPALGKRVLNLSPDFIFSFYYRRMLQPSLLAAASRGALNMHGSLLPRYRGRVPVNWAVINGETQTGATLHYMTARPDAGDIVDQMAVPILPDDTAFEVFQKVTVAAEVVLWRALPKLIRGDADRVPQDASQATYFGARRPEDGRIDWRLGARAIHNLVRGVAPPYPGAFCEVAGRRVRILRTRIGQEGGRPSAATLAVDGDGCRIQCADGGVLRVLDIEIDGSPVEPRALESALGRSGPILLESKPPAG
jgi:methionyl-tRNA formyltransferase